LWILVIDYSKISIFLVKNKNKYTCKYSCKYFMLILILYIFGYLHLKYIIFIFINASFHSFVKTHGVLTERLGALSSLTRSRVRPLSSSAASPLRSTCHPVRKGISLGQRSRYPWFYQQQKKTWKKTINDELQ